MLGHNNIFRFSNIIRIIILVAVLYAISVLYTYNTKLLDIKEISDFIPHVSNRKLKYILQWTSKYSLPFSFMGDGTSAFIINKCEYTNCFVTDNQTYFASLKDFDAIAFNGRALKNGLEMPSDRTRVQKYIFGTMESADNYPVCNPIFDGFFNWTWTYRLDSDFRLEYITVFDLNGTAVGPAVDMKWPNQLNPISNELKETLSKKNKAGAWFISNCKSKSNREFFMPSVMKELQGYNLTVDVYGACGILSCPRKNYKTCLELLKKEYYFYFSFENSFSEDYVTEKLLTALNNYAIPVVFGAADYTRYILQWTSKHSAPFIFMRNGTSAFIEKKCQYTNCFVTDNRTFFASLKDFDAIAFNVRQVKHLLEMPSNRSLGQKYIFGAMESADNFPICNPIFDRFFNWTWTYRLDSDFRFGYITIYDLNETAVGPAVDMKWPNQLDPITDELKETLSKKNKAGAWFVSNCKPKSKRQLFVTSVIKELKKYNWTVDIFGKCGKLKCPRTIYKKCDDLIKKNYYFYFSFENSFSEDYVTEKLLRALNNYAIPLVFGAANYTRFLPPGSYLDARQLGPKVLAKKMKEIILNKTKFYDYFRWRNHYEYRRTKIKEHICKLCEMMNNEEKINKTSEWPNFRSWWNGARYKTNCKT